MLFWLLAKLQGYIGHEHGVACHQWQKLYSLEQGFKIIPCYFCDKHITVIVKVYDQIKQKSLKFGYG